MTIADIHNLDIATMYFLTDNKRIHKEAKEELIKEWGSHKKLMKKVWKK